MSASAYPVFKIPTEIPQTRAAAPQQAARGCSPVPESLLAGLSLAADVPCGLPQGERGDEGEQGLER